MKYIEGYIARRQAAFVIEFYEDQAAEIEEFYRNGSDITVEGDTVMITPSDEGVALIHLPSAQPYERAWEFIYHDGQRRRGRGNVSWQAWAALRQFYYFGITPYRMELHDDGTLITDLGPVHSREWPGVSSQLSVQQLTDISHARLLSARKHGVELVRPKRKGIVQAWRDAQLRLELETAA